MKEISFDEFKAIEGFYKSLRACYENTKNYSAIKTLDLHFDLIEFAFDSFVKNQEEAFK